MRHAVFILAVLAAATAGVADYVSLRDGRFFEGRVVEHDAEQIRLDAIIAGIRARLVFDIEQVAAYAIVQPPLKPEADPFEAFEAERPIWTPEDPITRDLRRVRTLDRLLIIVDDQISRTHDQIARMQRWSPRSSTSAEQKARVAAALSRRIAALQAYRQRYQAMRDEAARRLWP
jgi:hypothetical protein